MRMSVTATSGLCARTLRSRSSASDACATTSKPASSSRRARPARSRTESSASTMRMGTHSHARRTRATRRGEDAVQRRAADVVLGDEPARAAARGPRRIQRVVGARRDDDGGAVAVGGEVQRDREAVHVGQAHVEQHDVGLQRQRRAEAGAAVGRLADDLIAVRLEHRADDRAEGGVVVDDQNGARHSVILDTRRQVLNGAGRTPAVDNRTHPNMRVGAAGRR